MSEEEPDRKSFYIFGTDVGAIPCFRSSYLYGTVGGVAAGLGTFLFTSKGRLSSNVGMSIFVTTTLTYWIRCRYIYAKNNFDVNQLKAAYEEMIVKDGTVADSKDIGAA